jgi:sporulation protein YlmC with PRC-barrel domain
MKFSELKGRAVVNLEDARKIGEVEDLMVEPESHHIVSVKVRTGMFHAAQVISVVDVKNVGGDAVTISTGSATAESTAGQNMVASQNGSAVGTTTATSSVGPTGAQPLIAITSILGNKVVTDAGTMLGELRDVMVDWVDLTITGYEVHGGGMFTKAQEFGDTPDVHYGNKLITIPAQLLSHPN